MEQVIFGLDFMGAQSNIFHLKYLKLLFWHVGLFNHKELDLSECDCLIIYKIIIFIEKRALESRLSSSRQLLVSQEESLRARENERKALKTRVVSADLHARDKEARLSSLSVSEFPFIYLFIFL